ncbi:type VII secretion system-associated protein [Salinifilum ghardaiensis]
MDTQQANHPVITPAMREQARKQPNTWLYVVDPIFTDPSAEVPPWGFIGGYRVDERGEITDDFSSNPNYRPSPVALRLPAPSNDAERAWQLTSTGYAPGQTLLTALLEASLVLFAQPQGTGLVVAEPDTTGRRQLQVFTSEQYLPRTPAAWQHLTGRQLAAHPLVGVDLHINPTSPAKARVPAEELLRTAGTHAGAPALAAGAPPQQAPGGPQSPARGTPTADSSGTSAHPGGGSAGPEATTGGAAAGAASATPEPASTASPAGNPATASGEAAGSPAAGAPAQQAEQAPGQVDPTAGDFGRRVLGALLGGAIGDALGAPVEFYPVDQIRSRFGPEGVTDYDRDSEHPGAFTDDTQLTLFTLEGLVRARAGRRSGLAAEPLPAVQLAYQRWLHTQGYGWARAAGPFADNQPEPTGWLIGHRELFSVRAPSSTCITALREFAAVGAPGTFDRSINESEDCGGVVRAAPVALWSDDPREVFELAAATAALTYSHPNAYLPAAVHAVLVHRLVRGAELGTALVEARALLADYRDHADTERALRAAVELSEQAPTPERVRDALGSGWAGHEALAIAVCAALATETVAQAVMTAVNHSGASDTTGALCGALVGARYGSTALPGVWLRDLRQRELVEQLTADALREFGPTPPEDADWRERYPAQLDAVDIAFTSELPRAEEAPDAAEGTAEDAAAGGAAEGAPGGVDEALPATADAAAEPAVPGAAVSTALTAARGGERPAAPELVESRVLGFLLGGAVGDALGYPVEDDELAAIRRKHGEPGVTDFTEAHRGAISDETQLTVFTLEGLIRASIRRRLFGEAEPGTQVQHAYQRWLHTQGFDWRDARGPLAADAPDGWLIQRRDLFMRRAPKTTCVQALHGYASGIPRGTFSHRVNDSKGSGGVMRAAPAGLWSADSGEVCQVGALTAVLTHGHPSGYLPAGALAVVVQQLLAGRSLPEAVDGALTELSTWDGHEETTAALRQAIELAASNSATPELIEKQLGSGEYGQEALAIGVCAALSRPESFSEAVLLAANHSGASDSTAAICGNIMGAARTVSAIPQEWREAVELRDVIEEIASDAIREFGEDPPQDEEWLHRYPVGSGAPAGPAAQQAPAEPAAAAEAPAEEAPAEEAPAEGAAETAAAEDLLETPDETPGGSPDGAADALPAAEGTTADAGGAEPGAEPSPNAGTTTAAALPVRVPGESTPARNGEDIDVPDSAPGTGTAGDTEPPAEDVPTGGAPTDDVPADPADDPADGSSEDAPVPTASEARAPADTAVPSDPAEQASAEQASAAEEDGARPETPERATAASPQGAPAPPGAAEQPDSAEDDLLSEEELRLLVAWRKFRETGSGESVELTHGLRKLLVEAFGQDRATQLLGEQESREVQVRPSAPVALDRDERLRGCVLGQAAGDALGAPWMFTELRALLRENPDGVREMSEFAGLRGAASRYGQQAVFLLDGLVRAELHSALRGVNTHWPSMVRRTLQHWLHTQGVRSTPELPPGELASTGLLHAQRFPDDASLTALAETAGEAALPSPANPPNDARTGAATARGAVVGLIAPTPRQAIALGIDIAVLTHGHPDGFLPAGAAAGLVHALHEGRDPLEAVEVVLAELDQREGAERTAAALRSAVDLARRGAATPSGLAELGGGRQAPEALAIAVAAVLTHADSFAEATSLAATHGGDSAASAAICGSLLGAARGAADIPAEWLSTVELHGPLDQLATDFSRVAGEIHPERDLPEWAHRYPSVD